MWVRPHLLKETDMLKIVIANLFNKNKKYAAASKINGATGNAGDGWLLYDTNP